MVYLVLRTNSTIIKGNILQFSVIYEELDQILISPFFYYGHLYLCVVSQKVSSLPLQNGFSGRCASKSGLFFSLRKKLITFFTEKIEQQKMLSDL